MKNFIYLKVIIILYNFYKPIRVTKMKPNTLFMALLVLLILGLAYTQKSLQEEVPQPSLIDENDETQYDPFKKRGPHHEKKKHRTDAASGQFPTRQEVEQQWGIYKPFDEKDDDYMQGRKARTQKDYKAINKALVWGMIAGTIFLAIVLAKTCMKKRGRRELRRINMMHPQLRVMNNLFREPQAQQPTTYIPQQQASFPNERVPNSLDQKIKKTELELIRLKKLQQEELREDFERKKTEQERKQMQMMALQQQQQYQQYLQQQRFLQQQQQSANKAHLGYGPIIYHSQEQQSTSYGQAPYIHIQSQNNMSQEQPFQVKGIGEICRKRVNSFKTQNSQRPIMNQNNQMKFRNGIPIGKPVKTHDNDSSFASDYPQV